MKLFKTIATAPAAVIALTFTAGCAGTAQLAPTSDAHIAATQTLVEHAVLTSHSLVRPGILAALTAHAGAQQDATQSSPYQPATCIGGNNIPKVYVSQFVANNVRVYRQTPGFPVGATTIGGLSKPQGVNVHGLKLYVANSGANNIRVFNRCGGSLATLLDPAGTPVDVAFDTSGNLFVTNIVDNGTVRGEVRYYAGASGTGLAIGALPLATPFFITVDTSGDVIIDGFQYSFSNPSVWWCHNTPGNQCTSGTATWQFTGISLQYPGGLRMDGSGNLVVNDQGAGTITTYSVGTFAPVSPAHPCPGIAAFGTADCVGIGLNQAGNRLYVADWMNGRDFKVSYPLFAAPAMFGPGLTPAGQVTSTTAWPAPPWAG